MAQEKTKLKTSLLTICISVAGIVGAARAAPTCTLQQIGELPITMERGRVLVDASVNGEPLKMLVDTGSVVTSFYRETAVKLGLTLKPVENVKMYGAGGGDILNEVGVKEFKVGGLVAHGLNVAVVGHQNVDLAAGMLGAGFLFQSDVEFDVPDGKLRFFKAVGCTGDQVVYWGKAYAVTPNISANPDMDIEIDTKVNGAPIRTLLDSGASASVVDPQMAERYADHALGSQAVGKSFGIGKESIDTSIATFPSFSFGDETIHNAKLQVADLFHADRDVETGSHFTKHVMVEPQMILGADFFRSHRIYISRSQRKIYASYMGGPVFDTRRPVRSPTSSPSP